MKGIKHLLSIMKRLRDPETGCPWDSAQSIESIAAYTIEEAYEVIDAIEKGDRQALKDELGDLLFHVVFYAEMASETGDFDFDSIAHSAAEKLERRHPHVFAGNGAANDEALRQSWEKLKRAERAGKTKQGEHAAGLLADIGLSMPALLRAEKLQKRAASVGFDWDRIAAVTGKIEEELEEIREAIKAGGDTERLQDEAGDLLFACVNLCRHLDLAAEMSLRQANRKFEQRFAYIEARLEEQGIALQEASLEQMDRLWDEAKSRQPS